MPIWLRNFTFFKVKEFYDKEAESSSKSTTVDTMPKGPAIRQPTYSTKAPK